jgi:hypothetical protein
MGGLCANKQNNSHSLEPNKHFLILARIQSIQLKSDLAFKNKFHEASLINQTSRKDRPSRYLEFSEVTGRRNQKDEKCGGEDCCNQIEGIRPRHRRGVTEMENLMIAEWT